MYLVRAVTPSVIASLDFDDYHYFTGEIGCVNLTLENYSDLYGTQLDVDLTNYLSIFDLMNTDAPYELDQSLFSETDEVWINDLSANNIASLLITRSATDTLGYTDVNKKLVARLPFIAKQSFNSFENEFIVSDDFVNLELGNSNAILKLSDSNASAVDYLEKQNDYLAPAIIVTNPMVSVGVDAIFDPLSNVSFSDNKTPPSQLEVAVSTNFSTGLNGRYVVTIKVTDEDDNSCYQYFILVVGSEEYDVTIDGTYE